MFDRRRFLMTAAAGAALAGVSGQGALARQTASDPAVAAAANDLYERIFQQALSASPEGLTSLGLDLSLIHIPSPRDYAASRMPSSA